MNFADRPWKRLIIAVCFTMAHGFISLALWGTLFARHMTTQGITSIGWEQIAAFVFWFPIGLLASGNPLAIILNSIALGIIIVARKREDRELVMQCLRYVLPKSRTTWLILTAILIATAVSIALVSESRKTKARNAPDEQALKQCLYRGSPCELKSELDKGHQSDLITKGFIYATWLYCYDRSRIPESDSIKLQKLKLLLDYGADVNAVTFAPSHPSAYDPPILEAADCCAVELIELLLAHNADLYLPNKAGRRAIDVLNEKRQKDNRLEAIWPLIVKHSVPAEAPPPGI